MQAPWNPGMKRKSSIAVVLTSFMIKGICWASSGWKIPNCLQWLLYSREQDVHGGGSGCGCSASVFAGYLMDQMETGKLKKVLLMSTGAMLSTISPFQGESIPGIAHAIALEVES